MKKVLVALVATLVAVSVSGCVGIGKGKGKAPPPVGRMGNFGLAMSAPSSVRAIG